MSRGAARALALAVAWGRVALGAAALVAPAVPLRPWVGQDLADTPGGRLLARALGGRDLALGLGVILALRHEAPARGWVEAGGLADTVDAAATLAAFRALPLAGRWAVLAAAGGAAAVSRVAAPAVD